MKYHVAVVQTLRTEYRVEAESDEEAKEKVLMGRGREEVSYTNDTELEIIGKEE